MTSIFRDIHLQDMDAGHEYGEGSGLDGLASYLEDNQVDIDSDRKLILDFEQGQTETGDDEPTSSTVYNRLNPFNYENNHADTMHHDLYDYTQHCHQQLQPPHDKSAQNTLIIISVFTFIFIVGEVLGGIVSGSLAILTDAAHMLSDLASFLISLFAIWFAKRPATRKMSFGYYRAEVLGAVCSILLIWVLTGILIYMAIERVRFPDFNINADVMLATACAGVIFNVLMGLVLYNCGGMHSHGHSHEGRGRNRPVSPVPVEPMVNDAFPSIDYRQRTISINAYPNEQVSHVNKAKNINIRAAFIHVLGDLAQSVGVLIAAIVIKFEPTYLLADPICTFLFSALVLLTTVTVMKDAVYVLMESTPSDVDYTEVRTSLEQISGVKAAHSLHMWSLTLDKAALAVHLAIDPSFDGLEVMRKASRMMKYKYNLQFTTIQIEPYDHNIMNLCPQCIGPQR